ncbi:hypothetical protein [Nannocystis bainbridge]|uniref:Outer membrane protein beta-barrel domain-containing protein n=1 Tax=Nannocystis bainbridge TaxID=2995303 RepID=A0ABT5E2E4_9BACT|nr:hypothetical protein [Nannocystis bainbridge]MDC0720041.1 hypothetical protein [Nannocystis bainbridge]
MTLAHIRAVLICLTGVLATTPAQAQEPAPATAPATTPATETAPVPAPPPASETVATPSATPEAGVSVPPPSSAPPPVAPPVTAPPTPGAPAGAPPTADAAPSFDWGGRQVEPLPAPPTPADPAKIKRDSWRGRYWIAPRLLISGPIGGDKPARPTLLTIGGGFDFGVRINNRLGVGMGMSGQTHTSVRTTLPGTTDKTIKNGGMFFWDPVFVRVYFMKKRFQPLMEFGVGYARAKMPLGDVLHGAQIRAGLGFDAWVSQQVTIGFTTVYRMIALHMPKDGITPSRWEVGHALQGALQLGLHW